MCPSAANLWFIRILAEAKGGVEVLTLCSASDILHSMEDPLTEESEARPTIAHTFNELEFVDLSLDDSI